MRMWQDVYIGRREAKMATRATVTYHTSVETRERLDRLAAETRRSRSFLTNEAVERYLAEEEAFMASVQRGIEQLDRGEYIEHDEVVRYFESLSTDSPLPVPTARRR